MATMKIDQLNSPVEQVVEPNNVLDIDSFFDEMYLSDSEIEERKDLAKNIYTILAAILAIIKANEVLKNNHDIAYYKDYVSSNLEIVFDNAFGLGAYRNLVQTFANDFIDSTMRHIDTPYFTSDDRAIVNAEQQSNAVYNQKQYENAVASGKTRKTWVTMHDQRVRKSHDAADGQEVAIDKPFVLGDSELMFPCDLSLGANLREICNCRCVVVYSGNKDTEDSVNESIKTDKQMQHIFGSKQYIERTKEEPTISYFDENLSYEDVVQLIREYDTKGLEYFRKNNPYPIYYVSVDRNVGKVYNYGTKTYQETDRIAIVHSSDGIHAYPVKNWGKY